MLWPAVICFHMRFTFLFPFLQTHQSKRQSEWTAEITLPLLPHHAALVSDLAQDMLVSMLGGLQEPASLFLELLLDSVREEHYGRKP